MIVLLSFKHSMMKRVHCIAKSFLFVCFLLGISHIQAQNLPPRYPMLELFTNTPCPICANQNPGLFNRLADYEGEYHLVSFYPGKPYTSCIFYNANIPENTARWQFYTGDIFGTPTVAINGVDFKNSNGVTHTVLQNITGGTSWLELMVSETTGSSRSVDITLLDHVGGSLTSGRLFAVIVEKLIQYNAPNGETMHHNVFRRFLTAVDGDEVDLSSGNITITYDYDVDAAWQEDQVYVIAWLMDQATGEIVNSGTRFDPDFTTSVANGPGKEKIIVYPNPSSDLFTIRLPHNQNTATVNIFNATGTLVLNRDFPVTSEIIIDASLWPEGSYIVQVKSGRTEWREWVRLVK